MVLTLWFIMGLTTRWFLGCPRPYFSLFDSAYGLVLHGHGRWSYRLMEVLNGEAIPVILADGWKLPLDTWLKMLEDGKSCLILKLLRTRLLVFFCLVGSVPFGAVSDFFSPAARQRTSWLTGRRSLCFAQRRWHVILLRWLKQGLA